MDVKVEIYVNRMVLSTDNETRSFVPAQPFSSVRLLVGDFTAAENCLKNALRDMNAFSAFNLRRPRLRIHPKELVEGGLSQIEKRVLLELGKGTGARGVEIVE